MIDKKLIIKKRILELRINNFERKILKKETLIASYRKDWITRKSNRRFSETEHNWFRENKEKIYSKIDTLEDSIIETLDDQVFQDIRRIEQEQKKQNLILILINQLNLINELVALENAYHENQNITSKNISLNTLNSFNPVEGGETTLYYLRLLFKGRKYYKIGVTLSSVNERYKSKDFNYIDKILYDKKITHANTIEKQILQNYKHHLFPLAILSSGHTEVFDIDVLELDKNHSS